MKIGKLDRRISIERFSEVVNAYGEREKTWATFITIWAALDLKAGRSVAESLQRSTEITKQRQVWRIRYSTDAATITAKDRVNYRGTIQDIIGVQEMGRGADYLITTETAE